MVKEWNLSTCHIEIVIEYQSLYLLLGYELSYWEVVFSIGNGIMKLNKITILRINIWNNGKLLKKIKIYQSNHYEKATNWSFYK